MTTIQFIVSTRKDEEILRLYRDFEQSGKIDKAFELRASYIRHNTITASEINWSNTLQTFVFEEALYLLNLSVTDAILKGKEPLEYENQNLQISRVTSFLMAEMINQDLFDKEDIDAKEILFKEILLLSPRFIAEQLSVYLFDILAGNDTADPLDIVLAYTNRFLYPIDSIKESVLNGSPIDTYLEEVEFSAEIFSDGEKSTYFLENVQNTYGFLFTYFLDCGNFELSDTYRAKVKSLLREEDFFFDIVSIFDKFKPNRTKLRLAN